MSSREGPDGAAVLTDLGRSIRSWVERFRTAMMRRICACQVVVQTGLEMAAAMSALGPALQRQSGTARAQTATEVGNLGIRLLAVIPRFRAALRTIILTNGDESVRTSALHALRLLGPGNASQVPALVAALQDELPAVRAAAAQDLAELGTTAAQSLPELIPLCLRDPDVTVRVQAGTALWRIGRKRQPTLSALVAGLRSGDPILCWTAADCLGDMGADAADARPALREALAQQQRPLIVTSIALALERIDAAAAGAEPGS